MALLVPNQGEQIALEAFLNKTAPQNLVLCLYTNAHTPVEADTEADYTEAAGSGYANLPLAGAGWTITPGAPSEASFAQQVFTFTGALGNVVGYFIKQTTSGKLVWAEEFVGGPFVITNNGDQIKVTPKITLE